MGLTLLKSKHDFVPILLYSLSILFMAFFLVTFLLGLRF